MNIMLAINFCDTHWLIVWLLPFILGFLSRGILSRPSANAVDQNHSQLKNQQSKISALESDLQGSRDKLHTMNDSLEISRRKVTELEGQLALEIGNRREIEEGADVTSLAPDNAEDIQKYKERISLLEQELTTAKGSTNESKLSESTSAYRQKITQLEAELAMAKGSIREYEEKHGVTNVKSSSSEAGTVQRSFGVIAPSATNPGISSESKVKVEPINPSDQGLASGSKISDKINVDDGTVKDSPSKQTLGVIGKDHSVNKDIAAGAPKTTETNLGGRDSGNTSASSSILEKTGEAKIRTNRVSSKKQLEFKSARSGKFKNVKEDDLTAIEGIGPKMAELLRSNGISSWAMLSSKTPKQLRELLSTYGNKYNNINPATWPRQANLAAGNNWTRLQKLQDDLESGKAKSKSSPTTKGKKTVAKPTKKQSQTAMQKKSKPKTVASPKTKKSKSNRSKSQAIQKESTTAKSKSATRQKAQSKSRIAKPTVKRDAKAKSKKGGASSKAKLTASSKATSPRNRKPKASVISSKLKSNNFQIIEGIGPKMNAILNQNGVKTWTGLSSKSPAQLRRILDKYGDKYRIIDPSAWPRQASYASNGQWNKLVKFQKKDGSDSKAEKVFTKLGITGAKADDFKLIEGIGPKIEGLIKKAGISTMGKLSKASTKRLQGILNKAGKRYSLADPSTWPKQASLIHKGKTKELERLQSKLKGGR